MILSFDLLKRYTDILYIIFKTKIIIIYILNQEGSTLSHDVFKNFRNKCYKEYKLNLVYYISASQLTYAVFIKITGQKLELITNQKYIKYERMRDKRRMNIKDRYGLALTSYF